MTNSNSANEKAIKVQRMFNAKKVGTPKGHGEIRSALQYMENALYQLRHGRYEKAMNNIRAAIGFLGGDVAQPGITGEHGDLKETVTRAIDLLNRAIDDCTRLYK